MFYVFWLFFVQDDFAQELAKSASLIKIWFSVQKEHALTHKL